MRSHWWGLLVGKGMMGWDRVMVMVGISTNIACGEKEWDEVI